MPRKRNLRAAVLAPIFAGTFVALLDLSIVIVALPTIQDELSPSSSLTRDVAPA